MRYKLLSLVALAAFAFAGGFAAQSIGPVFAQNDEPVLRSREIRAERIILRSPDKSRSITIQASDDGASIWLASKNGRAISIYDLNHQAAVCVYSDVGKPGATVALGVDKEGGSLQMVDPANGDLKIFGFDAFRNLYVNKSEK